MGSYKLWKFYIHVDKEVKFILVDKILFLGNVCSLVKIWKIIKNK